MEPKGLEILKVYWSERERERELRKCEKETPRKSMRTKNKGCLATRGPFGTCV